MKLFRTVLCFALFFAATHSLAAVATYFLERAEGSSLITLEIRYVPKKGVSKYRAWNSINVVVTSDFYVVPREAICYMDKKELDVRTREVRKLIRKMEVPVKVMSVKYKCRQIKIKALSP